MLIAIFNSAAKNYAHVKIYAENDEMVAINF
jgi:hypothetical protein